MTDSQVTLVGRIGQEPVTRATSRGEVLEFSVAVNDRVRGQDGQWTDGPTSWFRVSAWGALGRNAASSVHRGQPVVVRGTLRVSEWGPDGQKSRAAEVRAAAIGHDLTFGTAAFSRGGAQPQATQAAPEAAPAPEPALVGAVHGAEEGGPAPAVREPSGWGTTFAADPDAPF